MQNFDYRKTSKCCICISSLFKHIWIRIRNVWLLLDPPRVHSAENVWLIFRVYTYYIYTSVLVWPLSIVRLGSLKIWITSWIQVPRSISCIYFDSLGYTSSIHLLHKYLLEHGRAIELRSYLKFYWNVHKHRWFHWKF